MLLTPTSVRADLKDLPAGKIGATAGLRQGVGSLGNAFALGPLIGFEAGYHPRLLWFQNWSFGVNWSILWGTFDPDDASQVAGDLNVREMSMGIRIRRLLAGEEEEVPRFVVLSTGVSLLRSNVPLPPDADRDYIGPYLGFGVEQYLARRYLLSFEARYGIIGSGPGSFSFMVGFAFGSK
jgi:hypothetical protein